MCVQKTQVKPALPCKIFHCQQHSDSVRNLWLKHLSKHRQNECGKVLRKTHETATNAVMAMVKHKQNILLDWKISLLPQAQKCSCLCNLIFYMSLDHTDSWCKQNILSLEDLTITSYKNTPYNLTWRPHVVYYKIGMWHIINNLKRPRNPF